GRAASHRRGAPAHRGRTRMPRTRDGRLAAGARGGVARTRAGHAGGARRAPRSPSALLRSVLGGGRDPPACRSHPRSRPGWARALEPATAVWQTVNPGVLLVADSVVPSAIGAALQRPDTVVLALMRDASGLLLEDLSAAVEASARVIVIALDAGACDIGAAPA